LNVAMTIEGRKPSTPAGKTFRTEFWAWRPIHGYEVSDEQLKRWVEFLRSCGGFEVW